MIKIIRKADVVAGVPERWRKNYIGWHDSTGSKSKITAALAVLRSHNATFTAEQVDKIIGNSSWTRNECDECGKDYETLVHIGDEPDYEARWVVICRECLNGAIRLGDWGDE